MFMLDNKPLPIDTAFEHNDVLYPANWLRLASAEEKAELGITEVADQVRPDDRFYWVADNGDGTFTATPKELASVKAMLASQLKATAFSLLSATDYKLVRQVETGEPVDAATTAHRAAIRAAYAANAAAIQGAQDVAACAALAFEWPSAD